VFDPSIKPQANKTSKGIKAEWQDKKSGQWKTKWIQLTEGPFHSIGLPKRDIDKFTPAEREAYPHVSEVYLKMRCIYDTLMQVEYDTTERPLFSWIKKGPPIVIKEVKLDHLKLIVNIKDQEPTKLPAPRLISFEENRIAISRIYGPGVYFEPIAGLNWQKLKDVPVACAMCHVANWDQAPGFYSQAMHECTNSASTPCFCCRFLCRDCVWLNYGDLLASEGQYKFLRVPRKDLRGVIDIDGPSADVTAAQAPITEESEGFEAAAPKIGEVDALYEKDEDEKK
jgi:hypothetical protein